MTEPPEPRRPEEDGGDETDWEELERNATRDFVADSTPDMQDAIDAARAEYGDEKFDEMVAEVVRRANDPMRYTADLEELADEEQFEELDDDITMDVLGSGDDIADGGELTDMLSAWRDDVDSVPPSPGTAPETIQQIHDFTQEIDSATTPPRSTKGSVTPMTAVEDAARLRSAGARCYQDIGNALELFQQSAETLRDIRLPEISQAPASHVDVAKSVLGQGHANLNDIMAAHAALNELTEEIRTMVDAVHQKREAMQHVAGQIQGTFQDAATAIGGHSAG